MGHILIDVREPDEFAAGHAKGAINIPLNDIAQGAAQLGSVPKNAEVIVYCRSGNRSGVAMQILRQRGFTNVTNGINQAYMAENQL